MGKYYRLLPVSAILIIGIALSYFVQHQRNEAQLNLKSRELTLIVDNNAETIRRKLLTDFSAIEFVRFLFEKQDEISRQEFQNFTTPIFRGNSGISAISWVPKVTDTERTRFELKIRNEHLHEGFLITDRNAENHTVPAAKRLLDLKKLC